MRNAVLVIYCCGNKSNCKGRRLFTRLLLHFLFKSGSGLKINPIIHLVFRPSGHQFTPRQEAMWALPPDTGKDHSNIPWASIKLTPIRENWRMTALGTMEGPIFTVKKSDEIKRYDIEEIRKASVRTPVPSGCNFHVYEILRPPLKTLIWSNILFTRPMYSFPLTIAFIQCV